MSITWTKGAPPDEMKDGRDVLIYSDHWRSHDTVFWRNTMNVWVGAAGCLRDRGVTAWSEINPPEGVKP